MPRDPENPDQPMKLQSIKPPAVVMEATRQKIEHEHPVLNFVRTYMMHATSPDITQHVPVDVAFGNFQQFGKNENSMKIRAMNRAMFQEQLLKVDIDVHRDNATGINYFKGYTMSMQVPNLQGNNNDVHFGAEYVPSANNKRNRDDYNGEQGAY
jgi:hypothetical protein